MAKGLLTLTSGEIWILALIVWYLPAFVVLGEYIKFITGEVADGIW